MPKPSARAIYESPRYQYFYPFLTSDDPAAYKRVVQLLESAEQHNESLRLTTLVLLELMWVLKARYRLTRDEILDAIEKLLQMPVVLFESPECASSLILQGRATTLTSPIF